MQNSEIIVWGEPSWDTVASTSQQLWLDTRIAAEIVDDLGGSGANTASSLSLLGISTVLYGAIGDDFAGKAALAVLHEHGVKTELIRVKENRRTISVSTSDGSRTMFGSAGDQYSLGLTPKLDWSSSARVLHVSLTSLLRTRSDVLSALRSPRSDLLVSLDAGNAPELIPDNQAKIVEILSTLRPTILFANEEEYGALLSLGSNLLKEVKFLVVKRGADPCEIYRHPELIKRTQPPHQIRPVDTTGAGDAFAAGFLAGVVRSQNMDQCIALAHTLASICIRNVGATLKLKTEVDLTKQKLLTEPNKIATWILNP